MEKLFRGYISTSFTQLKQLYGSPKIENERVSWLITIDDKEYQIYDFLPIESSNNQHMWRVDSEFKDLSPLESTFQN